VLYLNIVKKFGILLLVFVVWRASLFFVGFIADSFLLYAPSFPYAYGILNTFNLPRWFYSWAGFDGVHYLTIMNRGYRGADLIQAFFPVYPYLTKLLNFIFDNFLLTSLLISNASFVILMYVWHGFIEQFYTRKIANWATISLLLFPTSFFFVASYTESLFLLLVILTFWFINKKNYWIAAICIALASATRITGILLIPAVLIEIIFPKIQFNTIFDKGILRGDFLQKIQIEIKNQMVKWKYFIKPVGIISLGSIGLLSYMYYLYKDFGDPLLFFSVQEEFGGGVRQQSFISYPQVIWRYIKILATARPFDLKYFTYIQEFLFGTLGLLGLIYSVKKTRFSYVIFALLAFFLPTLTGTFSSMSRYMLVCFPIFILLANWSQKSKIFRYLWFSISGILLVFNTLLFIQGYWVA
jgi:hypothetical protein